VRDSASAEQKITELWIATEAPGGPMAPICLSDSSRLRCNRNGSHTPGVQIGFMRGGTFQIFNFPFAGVCVEPARPAGELGLICWMPWFCLRDRNDTKLRTSTPGISWETFIT